MLITSRIKLILLSLLIPTLVITTLWSLTNNNNDTDETLDSDKSDVTLVEVPPVETISAVGSIRLPEMPLPDLIVLPKPVIVPHKHHDQIKCMAHNIYYEAGGEPYMGQVAVARVVMNRVNHGFAANPCQVIYQKRTSVHPETERKIIHCQFSWVCQGKMTPDTNSDRYKTAKEIAELVITEDKWNDEFHSGALFFHNNQVNPRWPYKKLFTIGNHIFYATHKPKESK